MKVRYVRGRDGIRKAEEVEERYSCTEDVCAIAGHVCACVCVCKIHMLRYVVCV